MSKPNILILMPDQQRADCMGSAGHPVIRTPNMDRLAAEGALFSHATTVSPVCMPARASFASGLYPHNHGMWWNNNKLPADDETVFQHLQGAGYCTAHIGKSHYYDHDADLHLRDCESYMHARGLEQVNETTGPHATCHTKSYMTDAWEKKGLYKVFQQDYEDRAEASGRMVRPSPLPVEDFLDSYVGRHAVEFVDNYNDDRPMCMFVGFGGPHEPWDAPGDYATMYDPADMPLPIPSVDMPASAPEWIREKEDFNAWPEDMRNETSAIAANYLGKISLIDYWIGRILDAFAARGWLDDLMVVLWSDHGEMLGDHGRFYKCTFHESSVLVPLAVRWPGKIPAGVTSDALAEIIDVFPTLLEAAGCEPSNRCQGRSLLPVLRGESRDVRDFQLSEIDHFGRRFMLRSRRYKYTMDADGNGFMLYDLENDPHEQDNLLLDGKHRELESEMREALLKRLAGAQYTM